jgi:hypothetical protein
LHDQEEVILIPVGPSSREDEEEEGREGGLGGAGDKEGEIRAQRPRRCQSVTVSLEAGEQLVEERKARGEEEEEGGEEGGKGKGKEEEEKLSLEIEQVEGFRPLGHMTHDAAAAVAT